MIFDSRDNALELEEWLNTEIQMTNMGRSITVDLLQKKYVLSLKVCSSLGQTLNYWVDWHLLKLAQPARL